MRGKKNSLAFLICVIPMATNVFICRLTWQGEVSHNKRPLIPPLDKIF